PGAMLGAAKPAPRRSRHEGIAAYSAKGSAGGYHLMRFGVRRGAVIAHAIQWKERDGQERFREFRDRPRELEAGVLRAISFAAAADWVLRTAEPVMAPPVTRARMVNAHGRRWSLEDLKPGSGLEGADLRGVHWRRTDLERVVLVRCDLRRADLEGANLRTAVL